MRASCLAISPGLRRHLPPAGEPASPVQSGRVQPGRAHTETLPGKHFPASADGALPREDGGEAGQLAPVVGLEAEEHLAGQRVDRPGLVGVDAGDEAVRLPQALPDLQHVGPVQLQAAECQLDAGVSGNLERELHNQTWEKCRNLVLTWIFQIQRALGG